LIARAATRVSVLDTTRTTEDLMASTLDGKRIAFLVAPEGAEQVELTEPWKAVEQAGGTPELVSTEVGKVQAFNHLTPADTFEADKSADKVSASDYDGLVLPGGVANPDILRTNAAAVAFAKSFFDAGKPVAVICHGPWTLIEADVVRGRMITSWPSVKTDLRNAGADWVDDEVVECSRGPNTLISSRKPDDLPAFCNTLIGAFAQGANPARG
jgi:protease I